MEKRNCPEARPAWTTTKLRRCIGSAALMVIVFFLFLSFFRGCHIESFDSRHGNSIAELGYPEKTTSKKQLPFREAKV
ncbi:hypothetical protein Cob_v005351 [Colletotrichum orbiculare MAFF 240422]|uniref:Uncharacterized protein n=1 Tax=Colletotrichum orbiculare (strain 104-T / ATCC 96160 / CBS 514.97 / LARS 414 / MAFF 240422) TaxID=1213857 RepID=A0A484FTG7_COLOR|nr:hypothetical protein Cob_v005351 [Colletotrichum orbiculare MAFF 240422]